MAGELKITALNAKTDLDEHLVAEFSRSLLDFPPEAILAAFRGWRDVSAFFPAISDIRELATQWVRREAEVREEAERIERRVELEAARERGEILEWADVVKKFHEITNRPVPENLAKAMPMPDPPREIVITEDRREMLRQQTEIVKARYQK